MAAHAEIRDRRAIAERLLVEDVGRLAFDPLGFVKYAYPWGEGELEGYDGPDIWQSEVLEEVGREIQKRDFNGRDAVDPIQEAVASGHGIGKGALTAFLVDFILSTRPHSKGIVTANTFPQLQTKTWPEIVKWTKRCITAHWFEISLQGMYIRHAKYPESWRLDAQTCRKENSEAFAGLHAATGSPFFIFDEASAIPDAIWDVAEGGLTDGEPFWFVFGNPTRNSGRFRECFGKNRHRWFTRQIDSRTCRFPNKAKIKQWIEDHGIDSDFVKVRVRGQFPSQAETQLIPTAYVDEARRRPALFNLSDPIVAGLDVAREGSAESVLVVRKGRDARGFLWRAWRERDSMALAGKVAHELADMARRGIGPHRLFVDAGGIGGPVADRLRQLGVSFVTEVKFGQAADESTRFRDKAAEMWCRMRDWLRDGGAIPDDNVLHEQLVQREYFMTPDDRLYLQSKDDMKDDGLESPDRADALALTFAFHVSSQDHLPAGRHGRPANVVSDYNPLEM